MSVASSTRKAVPSLVKQVTTRKRIPSLQEFVQDFVEPSRPLLVKNAFKSWCPNWTVDDLWKKLADCQEQVDDDEDGRILIPSPPGANYVARCTPQKATIDKLKKLEKHHQQQKRKSSLSDNDDDGEEEDGHLLIPSPPGVNYVSQYKSHEVELPTSEALHQFRTLSGGRQCRLSPAAFWDPETDELPPFMQDNAFDIIYDNSFVWITSPSLRTSLHPDPDEGIIAHLAGTKRAVLISPWNKTEDDLDQLFPYRWTSGSVDDLYLRGGQGGLKRPNDAIHLVELNPGDMLYIPKSWLHDIESVDETVSLVTRFEIDEGLLV